MGIRRLFKTIGEVYESFTKRVPTGELNRFVEGLRIDANRRIYFATQGSVRPPTFVFFTDKVRNLHFSDERFLVNRLREKFGFHGTPVVIKLKKRH
jgi:GTP-binding protein